MTQKTVTYTSYQKLSEAAGKTDQVINETDVSFYFRVFENGDCKELHIYYKK